MHIRRETLLLIAVTSACSQRAAWQVVTDPAPAAVSQQADVAAAAPAVSADSPALATAAALPRESAPLDAAASEHLSGLLFPVPAAQGTHLDDSFSEPRDGGARTHAAIDILAPRGSAILAADDGYILRMSRNRLGGITIYATDIGQQFVYYYAHLDRYQSGLYDGKPLTRGDTVGFVGTTGNAPENVPHLHFQVMRMPPDHKFWNGPPINPYPFLRQTPVAVSAP